MQVNTPSQLIVTGMYTIIRLRVSLWHEGRQALKTLFKRSWVMIVGTGPTCLKPYFSYNPRVTPTDGCPTSLVLGVLITWLSMSSPVPSPCFILLCQTSCRGPQLCFTDELRTRNIHSISESPTNYKALVRTGPC